MAVTSFKYASQSDLANYFGQYGEFDSKIQIFNPSTGSHLHTFNDVGHVEINSAGTYIDSLFINGEEQSAGQLGTPDADGEWRYTAATNKLEYYNEGYTATTINNLVFEIGKDFSTFIDQQLVNASMELNNLLDARYPTPLPKVAQKQADSTDGASASTSSTREYDALVIKATCYICASNLIRSKDPMSEQADYYYNLVTNAERTGIVDRLNAGEFKLSYEVDNKDSEGAITKITQSGASSMELVETAGQYHGEPFDILRITCTTLGAFGTCKCKVEYYGNDKLFGSESTNNVVSGSFDYWGALGGLGVRFSGAAMSVNDQWEIQVFSENRKISNASTGTINLSRKGKRF
tara:strand:- start:920 stop:1969 length:1050 start_codon:yes stop_codon:yes gene_type:complete